MSRGGRYIEWRDGMPYPKYAEPVTPRQMNQLLTSALSTPYEAQQEYQDGIWVTPPSELEFIGMTCGEVGAIKQARAYAGGDLEAGRFLHDRIIGKPKQQIESLNVNTTLKDYLGALADDPRFAEIKVEEIRHNKVPAITDQESEVYRLETALSEYDDDFDVITVKPVMSEKERIDQILGDL